MNEINDDLLNGKPYDQFDRWLRTQPGWLQDATWRMYNKRSIDDSQINYYAQMCLEQYKKKEVSFQQIKQDVIEEVVSGPRVIIKSIQDITSVNALADNTSLCFGDAGVSVIYGLNGSGKSGFMRIFKHVSEHPYAEEIQQNVFAKNDGRKPFCRFKISVGVDEQLIDVDLADRNSPNPYLRQCDVFDTRISNAYVSSSNSVSYEPFVFTVLKELATIAAKIQNVLESKINAIPNINFVCPEHIKAHAYAKWLEQLTDKTIIPEETLTWNAKDEDRIEQLRKLLDVQQVRTTLENKKYQKSQIQKILDELLDIEARITGTNREELVSKHDELDTAKKNYKMASDLFSRNATEQDKLSISASEFQILWKVGRAYYEKYLHEMNGNGFAEEGSICPMCLQKIDSKELMRFSSVDEYVNGSFSEAYSEAEKQFKEKLLGMVSHSFASRQITDTLRGIVNDDIIDSIVEFYEDLDSWSKDNFESSYGEICTIQELKCIRDLQRAASSFEKDIIVLTAALDEEKQKEYIEEYEYLQYRFWVYQQHEIIQTVIQNEQQKKELQGGMQYVKTNRITSESNQLAETLISNAYIERFNREIKMLAPHLKVKLEKGQSQKGRSPYKVVLDTADKLRKNPQDILSEGEQRIVALAAFFADATGRNEQTPIIIDDPISSLDYNYEEAATKRIVAISQKRQVIVFTHRISLLIGLGEICQSQGIPFTESYIRGTYAGKGVPDFPDVYHGKIDKQLNGLITRIREVNNMDHFSREYLDACSRISQQLRICVERSVEDILLQQMVKRFSRRIMTGKLMKLDRITSEDCSIIDSMMTKYSFNEHSQPEDSPLVTLNLEETIEDISKFVAWIKDYNKKMEK